VSFDLTLLAARHLGPSLLMAVGSAWRFREIDSEGRPATGRYVAGREIYALWHAQQLPLTLRHRRENIAVIISQHRDGEIIARMVEGIGYRTIRGSSTRGGSRALRELGMAAAEGHPLAITTDGPQGPARRCKPGAIIAAARTGFPIVPIGAAAVRAWTFDSWDRFTVPLPGSVVFVSYGEPLAVPTDVSGDGVRMWQERVTEAQNRVSAVCEEAARRSRNRSS